MRILHTFLLILISVGFSYGQSIKWYNTFEITEWEDAPELKFVERNIHYKPENVSDDLGGSVPAIKLEVTFKNTSQKTIRAVTFEILLSCYKLGVEMEKQQAHLTYNYPGTRPRDVPPNATQRFLHQPSVWGMTLPFKQVVRVSEIKYTDGSVWKREK